jgi:hypothetical protein
MHLAAPLLLVGLLIAGCASPSPSPTQVALKTQPAGSVCMDALTVGVLVVESESGAGLQGSGGVVAPVIWPTGWTARNDAGSVAIVDASGAIVAHVGETVSMGGGNGSGGDWYACAPVHVSTPSPT